MLQNIIYWGKRLGNLLGCSSKYQMKVLKEPIQIGNKWVYQTKLISKKIRIFGITIKLRKL